ncbi:uncharacterized protein EDB91DRAFT_61174 [Suillus paluster]|uniref:uncharacterized protein n=1 Tax=Suillus paluster TaxID=48578 RepID=UPI001B8775D6|nr:uncharacterized protein EDB91DRAFT_61174 [Suillus paluster]KAG1726251.1 hypothetical protein EDB91DRAFT_61174 [Suillus paluster]
MEPSVQMMPTLPALIQRREHLQSVINNMEHSIRTMLTYTRGFPDHASAVELEKMHLELHGRKTLFFRLNQAILSLNTNGALAHLDTTTAAGQPGVAQDGGAFQQPWPQSASNGPSLNFATNTRVNWPATGSSMVPTPQPPMIPNSTQPPHVTEMISIMKSGSILLPPQTLSHAVDTVQNMKQVFSSTGLTAMQPIVLSDKQRMEYDQLLDLVHNMAQDLDAKLPVYWILLRSDDMIRRLVAIVLTVAHQRASCSTGSSQVIIGFSILQGMLSQLQKATQDFEQRYQMMEATIASQQMGGGITAYPPNPHPRFNWAHYSLQPRPRLRRHIRKHLQMHIPWTRRRCRCCRQSNSTTIYQ